MFLWCIGCSCRRLTGLSSYSELLAYTTKAMVVGVQEELESDHPIQHTETMEMYVPILLHISMKWSAFPCTHYSATYFSSLIFIAPNAYICSDVHIQNFPYSTWKRTLFCNGQTNNIDVFMVTLSRKVLFLLYRCNYLFCTVVLV